MLLSETKFLNSDKIKILV